VAELLRVLDRLRGCEVSYYTCFVGAAVGIGREASSRRCSSAVKLNRGGNGLPLGRVHRFSRSSSKNGWCSSSKGSPRFIGSYTSNCPMKSVNSAGSR
jgi:hypothetical protein